MHAHTYIYNVCVTHTHTYISMCVCIDKYINIYNNHFIDLSFTSINYYSFPKIFKTYNCFYRVQEIKLDRQKPLYNQKLTMRLRGAEITLFLL